MKTAHFSGDMLMKILKITALCFAVVLMVAGLLSAKVNKYGVADVRKVVLTAPTRVGDVLLPQGQYEVRHVMEADSHIMVFKQLGSGKAEARVKCSLVPLKEKVDRNEWVYVTNAAGERVLQTLRFSGDMAEHVF
jgi:hypothetical protein